MKRLTAFALALLFLLTLTACGEKEPSNGPFENFTLPTAGTSEPAETSAPAQTEEPTESPTEEPPQPDDPYERLEGLVYEPYNDSGEYEVVYDSEYSNLYYYAYHLPMLTASTEGARAINDAIDESFGQLIEDQYAAMKDGVDLSYNIVSWYPSFYKDLVILLVVAESNYGFTENGVYCYEKNTGRWLQGRELLDYLYIEEEVFLEATRQAAEECFVSFYGDIPEEDREAYGYDRQLAWTVSDENINLDNLMFYPDLDGNITVIARIGSLAGADWYYQYLYPEIAFG